MRRTAAVLACTALVLCSAPPAQAEDSTVVVHGTDVFGSDETTYGVLLGECWDPWVRPTSGNSGLLYIDYTTDEPPIGLRVHGFETTDAAAGPYGFTPTPSTSVWSMRARSTNVGTSGHAVAYYFPPNDFSQHYWFGSASVNVEGSSWQTVDAQSRSLQWRLIDYSDGTPDPTGQTASGTVAAFTATHGGDGSLEEGTGAFLGFLLGCDGDRFYFDGLRLGAPGSVTTYDYEGALSQALMRTANRAITAGGGVRVAGLPHPDDRFAEAEMVLQSRPFGAEEFTELGRATSRHDDETFEQLPATLVVKPRQRTEYRWVVEDNKVMEGSTSDVLVVTVRTKVALALRDDTLRVGQDLVATGGTTPAKAKVPVRLQRLVGKRWRTVDSGRTTRGGGYRLEAPMKDTGAWKVRVVVDAASGNLAGTSPVRKATIR